MSPNRVNGFCLFSRCWDEKSNWKGLCIDAIDDLITGCATANRLVCSDIVDHKWWNQMLAQVAQYRFSSNTLLAVSVYLQPFNRLVVFSVKPSFKPARTRIRRFQASRAPQFYSKSLAQRCFRGCRPTWVYVICLSHGFFTAAYNQLTPNDRSHAYVCLQTNRPTCNVHAPTHLFGQQYITALHSQSSEQVVRFLFPSV
jgi:hypothetical protein